MAKIKKCIIWTNGLVSSFDEKEDQIPEYQGFILDIADKLKDNCDEDTKWFFGKWQEWANEANFSWYWGKKKSELK